jgi:hypothetical protein
MIKLESTPMVERTVEKKNKTLLCKLGLHKWERDAESWGHRWWYIDTCKRCLKQRKV